MDIKNYMHRLGQQAKQAGREISRTDSSKKNHTLLKISEAIENNRDLLSTVL